MSSYEVIVEEDETTVELGNSGGIAQASLGKAGQVAMGAGQDGGSVSFASTLSTPVTTFALLLTVMNTVSSFPQDLSVRVSAFTVNGFSFKLSAPTDDGNYIVNWMLVPAVNG